MKTVILGTGSIGSLVAAHLAQVPDVELLCVVASDDHCRRINEEGITIKEANGSDLHAEGLRAVTDTSGEDPADLIIVTVKAYNTWKAVKDHKALFGPDTLVLTLQNGYGAHEDLQRVAPDEHIFLGSTNHGVNIDAEGVINHAGDGPTILGPFVKDNEDANANAARICDLLCSAGLDVRVSDDIYTDIFRKLLVNVAINPVCAAAGIPNGRLLRDRGLFATSERLMKEAIMILNMHGYPFDFEKEMDNLVEVIFRTSKNICSMLADVQNGRPTEIRYITGAIVELASQEHVDAPYNRMLLSDFEYKYGEA